MELITLRTYENPIDLHIVKARLESEGITCFVFDEHIVSVNPLYNITVGGIKLKVRENELEKAIEILKDIDSTPISTDQDLPLTCPNCSSANIESGHRSLNGIKAMLSGILSFLFLLFPIYVKRSYHCRACDTNFSRKTNSR